MDIVTHGMIGVVLASPLTASHPEAAAALMLGSVLPDMDVVGRVFGKRAFLHAHQSYTHAFPLILLAGLAAFALQAALGLRIPEAAAGLAAGMTLHVFLDLTNTYGIMILAPFTRRRFSVEWVFFVDVVVLALTIPPLVLVVRDATLGRETGWRVAAAYGGAMTAYWVLKALLRFRAARVAPPRAVSLLPDTFLPWRYHGYGLDGCEAVLFEVNAVTGRVRNEVREPVHDGRWADLLETLPEYREMRNLSPGFHVVAEKEGEEGTLLECRDLRTRNFGGTFGELDVLVDGSRAVRSKVFHV